ncbi:MAG: autotransporter domain-containing protein [Elusimicrobiota bacterium]|jgi:predicted outer membrane repeat protein|nr:autotransporter domain-containing protein [Elusimicrobiota bacterium]
MSTIKISSGFSELIAQRNRAISGGFIFAYGKNSSLDFSASGVLGKVIMTSNTAYGGGGGNAEGSGGAIRIDYATMTIRGAVVELTYNTARSSGGAIYAERDSEIMLIADMGNINFIGNTSGGGYNDIFLEKSSLMLANDNNYEIRLEGGIYAINKSKVEKKGAGLLYLSGINYFDDSEGFLIYDAGSQIIVEKATFTYIKNAYNLRLNNSRIDYIESLVKFTSNTTDGSGGAIYAVNGSAITFLESTAQFRGNISKNIWIYKGIGGAIYLNSSIMTFENSSASFIGNIAASSGGAIYLDASIITYGLAMKYISFSSNIAGESGAAFELVNGSIMDFGSVDWFDASNNESVSGDGILYWDKSSTMSLTIVSTLTAINNRAQRGGFLYLEGREFGFNDIIADISSNTAKAGNGGGIYLDGSTITFTNSQTQIKYNKSQLIGGAIYARGSKIEFNGGEISFIGNTAKSSGAAIYMESGSQITFNGQNKLEISGNESQEGDGVIFWDRTSIMTMENISVLNAISNKAQRGGFLYFDGQEIILGNIEANISSNVSQKSGGAIYFVEAEMKFNNSQVIFSSNTAIENGGALYLDNSRIEFNGGQISFIGNTAKNGAAIYIGSNSYAGFLGDASVNISSNESQNGNGTIYLASGGNSQLEFLNSGKLTAIGNKAVNGGFLYLSATTLNIDMQQEVNISSNTAKNGNGGALYLEQSQITIKSGAAPMLWESNIALGQQTAGFNIRRKAKSIARQASNSNGFEYETMEGTIGLGGAIYAKESEINIEANNNEIVFKGNKAQGISNDIYIKEGALNLSGANSIRFESGIYASSATQISKSGLGLLYMSGFNYFEDIGGFDIGMGSSIEIENSSFIWINNKNSALSIDNTNIKFMSVKGQWENSLLIDAQNNSLIEIDNSQIIFSSNINMTDNGGAIRLNNSEMKVMNTSVSFIGNTAQSGAISYIENNGKAEFTDIYLFEAIDNESIGGHGVISYDGTSEVKFINISSMIVKGNKAQKGSFMLVSKDTTLDIGYGQFTGNAANASGGVFYITDNVEFIIRGKDIEFTSNTAMENGGALYAQNNAFIDINLQDGSIIFEGNEDISGANDIYIEAGKLNIIAAGIENKIKIKSGIIAQNQSIINLSGDIEMSGKSIIEDSSLNISNSTASIIGIFKYNANAALSINNSSVSITGNSGDIEIFGNVGGGIIANNSYLRLEDISKTEENIGTIGGGILVGANSKVEIIAQSKNIIFQNNENANGLNDIYMQADTILNIESAQGREIIFNGGIKGDVGTTINKTGQGQIIIKGETEIGGTINIDEGIVKINLPEIRAQELNIRNGSLYEIYQDGASATIVDILSVESSTISLNIYFNDDRWKTDLIRANSANINSSLLLIGAYGNLSADIIGSSAPVITGSGIGIDSIYSDGLAFWHKAGGKTGLVEYDLDYDGADILYIVIRSTTQGAVSQNDLSGNQNEAANYLNKIDDYSGEIAKEIMFELLKMQKNGYKEELIKKILDELSGEFIVNVLNTPINRNEMSAIYAKIDKEAIEAQRSGIWAQAQFNHFDRQEEESQRKYEADMTGAKAGVNIKMDAEGQIGLFVGYSGGSLRQAGDEADMKDINMGIYGGNFGGIYDIRWAIIGGIQDYDASRQIRIISSSAQYSPQSQFETYSIKAGAQGEFKLFPETKIINVNPIIGVEGIFVILNKDIEEEKGGVTNLIIKSKNNMKINIDAGLKLYGEIAKTRWTLNIKGVYALTSSENLGYEITFKEGQEYGNMKIVPAQAKDIYAAGTFILEKEINEKISLYALAIASIDPESKNDIMIGYGADIGINYRFGQKTQNEDWNILNQQKQAEKQRKKEEKEALKKAQEEEKLAAIEMQNAENAKKDDSEQFIEIQSTPIGGEIALNTELEELRAQENAAKIKAQAARKTADEAKAAAGLVTEPEPNADKEEAKTIKAKPTEKKTKSKTKTAKTKKPSTSDLDKEINDLLEELVELESMPQ